MSEIVYITKHQHTHTGQIYHNNPDCDRLSQSQVRAVERDVLYDDAKLCGWCDDPNQGQLGTTCPYCDTDVHRLPEHLTTECPEVQG